MKELADAAGIPKSTILHYVNEGLLPEPVKTSSNMAYYHPDCIERIGLIKSLQRSQRLPLSRIRSLLEHRDLGHDVSFGLELLQGIFGADEGPTLNESEFCDETGLSPDQVKRLMEAELLMPLNKGRFDQEDVGMARIYGRGIENGITVEDMSFYPRLGKLIVEEEMALRRRVTHHLSYEADAERTLRMVHAARATRNYVLNRLFQHRVAACKDIKD